MHYVFAESVGDQGHIVMKESRRMIGILKKTIDTRKMIKIGIKMRKTDIPIEIDTRKKKRKGISMREMINIPEMKNTKSRNTEMKKK